MPNPLAETLAQMRFDRGVRDAEAILKAMQESRNTAVLKAAFLALRNADPDYRRGWADAVARAALAASKRTIEED